MKYVYYGDPQIYGGDYINTTYTSKGKVLKFTSDVVFKNILKDKHNRKFLAKLISLCTNFDYFYVLKNIVISDTDTLETNNKEHYNHGDLLVNIKNNKINIEVCIGNKNINKRKNEITSFKYASNSYRTSEKYNKVHNFIQIAIEDYNVFHNNYIINEVKLVEITSGNYEVETEEFIKYHISLPKLKKKCYNEDVTKLTETERMLLMFITDDIERLKKIIRGDDILEETFASLKSVSENDYFISAYEKERIWQYCAKQDAYEREQKGIKKGIKQGIEQGINEGKMITAKNLINKNIDLKTISEATGIPINKLKNLN